MAVGVRIGARIGASIGTPIGSAGGLAGVTRDATSDICCPANAAEWAIALAAAGITNGGPSSTWNLQDASGNAADAIGAVTLTSVGAPAYQQPVTGWSRKAVVTTDGNATQHFVNNTTAPDPSLVSTLQIGYISFTTMPAALRSVMCTSLNTEVDLTVGGALRMGSSASIGAALIVPSVQCVVNRVNLTASTWSLFNLAEKITATFVAPGAGKLVAYGAASANAPGAGYMYGALLSGAAAELTNAQLKTLLTTLGWPIAWT